MVSLVFFYILQLPHTVISNSEKLTHPTAHALAHSPGQRLGFAARPDCRLEIVAVEAQLLQRRHTKPLLVTICREKNCIE